MQGNAVISQSGGPTAVINQSLVGCIEGLAEASAVKKILGARHAVQGIVEENFVDLTDIPRDRLERVAATPSSVLGSSRIKPNAEFCARIFDSFSRNQVRYFFYIGGNDSADTCRIVNEVAQAQGYELRTFHIPKTIDNDLCHNDHTPGFPSAARFVACAFLGDSLDNRALPGIKINIVMGRHAGFLTAASLLARRQPGEGPHLIYVPEVDFEVERFLEDVSRTHQKHGRCQIAVSEGIHDSKGTPIALQLAEQVERDAHGNVQLSGSGALGDHLAQLIKSRLDAKLRVRADTFGYLQRSFAGCVSEVDQAEARAVGREAAHQALAGAPQGSIAIQRANQDPYRVVYKLVELTDVAQHTRTLPEEYFLDGCDIADSYRDYLAPLVGTLPEVEFL
ncbi:MAG: 6-phosphofructokinase [Planctomycetota bacterium]